MFDRKGSSLFYMTSCYTRNLPLDFSAEFQRPLRLPACVGAFCCTAEEEGRPLKLDSKMSVRFDNRSAFCGAHTQLRKRNHVKVQLFTDAARTASVSSTNPEEPGLSRPRRSSTSQQPWLNRMKHHGTLHFLLPRQQRPHSPKTSCSGSTRCSAMSSRLACS